MPFVPIEEAQKQSGGGLFSRLAKKGVERISLAKQAFHRGWDEAQDPFSTNLQVTGQVAGFVGDVVGEGIKSVAGGVAEEFPALAKSVSDTGKQFLASDAGKKTVEVLKGGMEKWGEFKESHPTIAADAEAILNIADVATMITGAGLVRKPLKEAAEVGLEATAKVASKAITGAQKAVKDIGESGIVKAVTGKASDVSTFAGRAIENVKTAAREASELKALPQPQWQAINVGVPRETVTRLATMTEGTKAKGLKMLDILESRDPKTAAGVRVIEQPKLVVGEEAVGAAESLAGKLKETGGMIGERKKVWGMRWDDPSDINASVLEDVSSNLMRVDEAGNIVGKVGSTPDQGVVDVLAMVKNVVGRGKKVRANQLDQLRVALTKHMDLKGIPFSPKAKEVAGKYYGMIAEKLGVLDPEYKRLASIYSEQVNGLRPFVSKLGQDIEDLTKLDAKTLKAAEFARRTEGEAAADAQAILDGLLATAKKYGYESDVNLSDLIRFNEELKTLFGTTQKTSLEGTIDRAGQGLVESIPVIGGVAKKVKELGTPSAEMKMKALRELLKKSDIESSTIAPPKLDSIRQELQSVQQTTPKISSVASEADALVEEAKKFESLESFLKMQGTTAYRGGSDFTGEKIGNAGMSVSRSRSVAEDFAKHNNGKVEEILISPKAKIIDYGDVPDVKYKDMNDYSPELDVGNSQIWKDLESEYQKAIDWARSNGYDVIRLPLEGEMRIINPDAVRTKAQIIESWNKASGKTYKE